MSTKFWSSVANSFNEAKAWKACALTLAFTTSVLSCALVYQRMVAPVYLIPHQIASASGHIKVQPGSNDVNVDYLQYVLEADIDLLLNWNEDNVISRLTRFLNRTTTELFSRQRDKLLADGKKYKDSRQSQSFYPSSFKLKPESLVAEVSGTIVRRAGDQTILREYVTYEVFYKENGGMFTIDNLVIKKQQ